MFSRLILVALICGAAWAFPQGSATGGASASVSVSTDASTTLTASLPADANVPVATVTTLAPSTVPAIDTTLPPVTLPTTQAVPAIDTTLPPVTLPTTQAVPAIDTTLPPVTFPTVPDVPAIDTTLPPVTLPPALTLPSASQSQTIAQYMKSSGGYITTLIDAIQANCPEAYSKLSDPTNPVTFFMPYTTQLTQMFNSANAADLPANVRKIVSENMVISKVTPATLAPSTILQNIYGLPIPVIFGLIGRISIGPVNIGLSFILVGGNHVVIPVLP